MRLGGGGDGATQPLGRDPPFGSGTWRGCSQGGGEGKCQCSAAALEQELGPGVWQGRALRTPHSWECVQQLGTRGGERHDPPAPSHVASQWTVTRGSWAIPPSPIWGLDRWPYPGTGDDKVLSKSGPPHRGDQSWRPYTGPLLKRHFPSSGLDSPKTPLSDSLLLVSRQGSAPFTASAELPQPALKGLPTPHSVIPAAWCPWSVFSPGVASVWGEGPHLPCWFPQPGIRREAKL